MEYDGVGGDFFARNPRYNIETARLFLHRTQTINLGNRLMIRAWYLSRLWCESIKWSPPHHLTLFFFLLLLLLPRDREEIKWKSACGMLGRSFVAKDLSFFYSLLMLWANENTKELVPSRRYSCRWRLATLMWKFSSSFISNIWKAGSHLQYYERISNHL